MKKMASLLVVAALLICMAVPAFAATGINTYEAPYELHQRLGKELVNLVSIVVNTRYKVSCLILVKKIERKFLQFIENRISKAEEHPLTNTAHHSHLCIVDGKCHNKHYQEYPGEEKHTMIIFVLDMIIDCITHNIRSREA